MYNLEVEGEHHYFAGGFLVHNCNDCLKFAHRGWLTVTVFVQEILARGYAPRSGKLECRGFRCKCLLEEQIDGEATPVLGYA